LGSGLCPSSTVKNIPSEEEVKTVDGAETIHDLAKSLQGYDVEDKAR